MKQSANFDQGGTCLVTETEIKKSELPKTVSAAIDKELKGFKIEEVEQVETPDQETLYEVSLEKGKLSTPYNSLRMAEY